MILPTQPKAKDGDISIIMVSTSPSYLRMDPIRTNSQACAKGKFKLCFHSHSCY